MQSPVHTRNNVEATVASPQHLLALANELLQEIFLRIGCVADLTRASAVCVAFRRLIADPTFLHRYNSHHELLLLGFLDSDPSKGFHPLMEPHPNALAACYLANISFDYLPPPKCDRWYTCDVRDGRILFECSDIVGKNILPDLVVCDRLSRRLLMLPPLPQCGNRRDLAHVDAVFVPCEDKNKETSFRVMAVMRYFTGSVFFVIFDSGSGSWTINISSSWDALGFSYVGGLHMYPISFAYGCFYWKVYKENELIKLDIDSMELSSVFLPPQHELMRPVQDVVVFEAGEGILGMFSFISGHKFLNYYHYDSQIADEWRIKTEIPLPVHDDLWIIGAIQGFLFLQANQKVKGSVGTTTYYSLDTMTLKLERVMQISSTEYHSCPYFSFRPSISPILIG